MEKNEVKKDLYKEDPVAILERIVGGVAYYKTHILSGAYDVLFAVPVGDMGEASFYREMSAKLLIRYISE